MSNDNNVGIEWVEHCDSNDWYGIDCADIEDATTETLIETMLEINQELLRRERSEDE